MDDVTRTLALITAACVAVVSVAAAGRLALGVLHAARRLADMHDLVTLHLRSKGERQLTNPADHREGMLDRLGGVEHDVAGVRETVDRELHPNGSKSMHDRVRFVEGYVTELREREKRGTRHHREPRPSPVVPEPLDDHAPGR